MTNKFEFYKLNNGVKVVLIPMAGVASVACGVYVKTGSRYETDANNGISHFLEHMAFKGTKKLPTHKETSYLEGLGAIQNAWTDVGATAYWCKIPADKWQEGLEVAKELALYPTIPETDLEIERGVILEEINRRDDRPDEMVEEKILELMYKNNPLGKSTLGPPSVIKKVTRQDFLDYHDSQYVANNITVVIAGKLPENSKFKSQITNWFGELGPKKAKDFEKVDEQQTEMEVLLHKRKEATQFHIELAVRGITNADPRRFALALLTAYLGQGLSSRLFTELREKQGLCYSVSAGSMELSDTGTWGVYAGVAVEKLFGAVSGIWAEMKRVREVKLIEAELTAAKEKIRGPLLFAQENPIHQMEYYAKQAMDRPEEILTYDQVIDRLMGITSSEIQLVAQQLFVPEKVNLAIVGPTDLVQKEKLRGIIKL